MSFFADTTCTERVNDSFQNIKVNSSFHVNRISTSGYVVIKKDIGNNNNINESEERDPLNREEKKAIHDSFIK